MGEYCTAQLLPLRDVTDYNTGLLLPPLPPARTASCSTVRYSSSGKPSYCTVVSSARRCSLHPQPGIGKISCRCSVPAWMPGVPKDCLLRGPDVTSCQHPRTNTPVPGLAGMELIFFTTALRVPCFGCVSKTGMVTHQCVFCSFPISEIREGWGQGKGSWGAAVRLKWQTDLPVLRLSPRVSSPADCGQHCCLFEDALRTRQAPASSRRGCRLQGQERMVTAKGAGIHHCDWQVMLQ